MRTFRIHQVQGVDFGSPFPTAPVAATTAPIEPSNQVVAPSTPEAVKTPASSRTAPPPKPTPRRSPRVSQSFVALDDVDTISPEQPQQTLPVEQGMLSEVEQEREVEEAEAIDDETAAQHLGRPPKRKSDQVDEHLEAEELEEEEEEHDPEPEQIETPAAPVPAPRPAQPSSKRRKTNARGSPAAQRQPKKPKAKSKTKAKSTSRKSGETIPVVVHRLTKPVPYGEDDTDADILNEDMPFAKRSGVNAVDVLSQFCEEVIESGLTALEEGGSNAEDAPGRREYTTKLRAVEAFQEELRTRLLELVSPEFPFFFKCRLCI
jgi:hypothetical protein